MNQVKKTKVLRSDLNGFLEEPTVAIIVQALNDELDRAYQARADCFFHDDPIKTHVARAMYMGEEQKLKDLIEVLEGDRTAQTFLFEGNGVEIVEDVKEEDDDD